MSSFRIFYILILNLCVMNSFGFWSEDYKPYGGMELSVNKHALVFYYKAFPDKEVEFAKNNVKIVSKHDAKDQHYPYITFFSDPDLKTAVAKIDEFGFAFNGKSICSPRKISDITFLCPNPIVKFSKTARYEKTWYATVEFEQYVNKDVVETSYNGTKLFFKLSDTFGSSKELEYDLTDENRPVKIEIDSKNNKESKVISFVWIRPSSKSIRDDNYKKISGVADFLSKIKTCIKKKDYVCIKNNSDASYEEYFLHFLNFYFISSNDFFSPNYKENDEKGSFYQTQSMLASLEDCLMNGEVLLAHTKDISSFFLGLKSSKGWKTSDGKSVPFMRCGLSAKAADPKVKDSKDEIKLFFTTQEYL